MTEEFTDATNRTFTINSLPCEVLVFHSSRNEVVFVSLGRIREADYLTLTSALKQAGCKTRIEPRAGHIYCFLRG
jgi:hypothetical protein